MNELSAIKRNSRKLAIDKRCPRCVASFAKPSKISWAQWAERIFCSKTCAKGLPPEDRIAARTEVRAGSDCHWWTGPVDKDGYGVISIARHGARKSLRAHRVAFEMAHGPLPRGQMVLHSCDNPACVNLMHLRAGTAAENMADKMARGRHRNQHGACYAR